MLWKKVTLGILGTALIAITGAVTFRYHQYSDPTPIMPSGHYVLLSDYMDKDSRHEIAPAFDRAFRAAAKKYPNGATIVMPPGEFETNRGVTVPTDYSGIQGAISVGYEKQVEDQKYLYAAFMRLEGCSGFADMSGWKPGVYTNDDVNGCSRSGVAYHLRPGVEWVAGLFEDVLGPEHLSILYTKCPAPAGITLINRWGVSISYITVSGLRYGKCSHRDIGLFVSNR